MLPCPEISPYFGPILRCGSIHVHHLFSPSQHFFCALLSQFLPTAQYSLLLKLQCKSRLSFRLYVGIKKVLLRSSQNFDVPPFNRGKFRYYSLSIRFLVDLGGFEFQPNQPISFSNKILIISFAISPVRAIRGDLDLESIFIENTFLKPFNQRKRRSVIAEDTQLRINGHAFITYIQNKFIDQIPQWIWSSESWINYILISIKRLSVTVQYSASVGKLPLVHNVKWVWNCYLNTHAMLTKNLPEKLNSLPSQLLILREQPHQFLQLLSVLTVNKFLLSRGFQLGNSMV